MSKNKITVLLVEDEQTLAMIIKDTLEENDFIIHTANDGEEGLSLFFELHPDVLVADVMMPKMDGFEMVRRIRQTDKQTPVLFLTARSAINDVVEGFELGANDYLKKPFGIQELIIRIKALMGKAFLFTENKVANHFEIGSYLFDPVAQTLLHAGTRQELSHRESEILKRLCENRNQVVNTQDVLLELWGDDSFFNSRSLHVFITKLRHKLSQDEQIRQLNSLTLQSAMNKRQFTGFMFLLCTCTAFAQQVEVKKDSIGRAVLLPPEQKQPLNMDKEGFILPDMNITPNDRKPTIQTDSMTLHISPPEFIDTPWPTPRLGTSFDPFSRDYNRSDIFGINANSYLSTYSLHNTYPTMGTHIQVGAIYTYAPNERWELSGGLFSAKYTMPSFQHGARNDFGFSGSAAYRINNFLRIRAFGEYSVNGERNASQGYLTPIYPVMA